jgi:hypothetical protein
MDPMSPEELVAPYPDARRRTVEALRSLVRRVVPDVLEAVRPGWRLIGYRVPMGRRAPYFGFVWPEPEHVHLGFEYGIFMDDPDHVLLGSGRKLRWVTLYEPDDMPADVLERLVREAVRVAAQSRSERLAMLLDREAV